MSAAMVISQTREVHELVEPRLAGLRRARDLQHIQNDSSVARSGSRYPTPLDRDEFSAPSRYVLKSDAGWLVPRVHE